LTDYEDFGPEACKFHAKFKWHDVERHGLKKEEIEKTMKDVGYADVNVVRAFSTEKKIEEGQGGGTGDFPFLLCLGKRL
jgi:hypothetical protein